MYLAAAGVGKLTLVDDDKVDLTNLQRQIIHRSADTGKPKVETARATLHDLNPEVEVETMQLRAEVEDWQSLAKNVDVVVDGTDNFQTRFAINQACVTTRTPLVSGAAVRMEGQVSVFRLDREDSPCYRCLYPDQGEETQTCSENGVLAPVVGIIGSIQAVETLKLLAGVGELLESRLLLMDASTMEWRTMKFRKDPSCPVCAS